MTMEATATELGLAPRRLHEVRRLVERKATEAGFPQERVEDVVFAVNEVATNALRHGDQPARIRVWHDGGHLICEVTDAGGRILNPMAGRKEPAIKEAGGLGLWAARQMCEAIEFRSSSSGTVVSVHASA
jgi:anti-sigma regulatory factor (Ser/Thr protein kinase)